MSYHLNFAEEKGDNVRQEDNDTTNDKSDGRLEAEVIGPERKREEARCDPGVVVDIDGIARDTKSGQAHEKGQDGEANSGTIGPPQGSDLGLEVEVLGVDLKVGRVAGLFLG